MQEDYTDPRSTLLSNIDFSRSKIVYSNTPIVLLCGGTIPPEKNSADDKDPDIASLRDAIRRNSLAQRYYPFLPEHIKTWHADSIYEDLMAFESDLASICSLVVIVLESAGSLVELGAFSQQRDLINKMIVIKSSSFSNDSSFITLGILRYISKNNKSIVKTYPWDIDHPQDVDQEVIEDIVCDINETIEGLHKSESIKIGKPDHVIVLICEIIKYFIALKEHEILEYLIFIGVIMDKASLKSKLFLLDEFKIIKKEEYSEAVFWMYVDDDYYHKINFCTKDGKALDLIRFKTECSAFYRNNRKYRNHSRVILKKINRGRRI
jgi:hypothetical protein